MSKPRRAGITLLYNGVDAEEAGRWFDGMKYNDVASGICDDISLEFSNREGNWYNGYFPQKGDRLEPTIILENWNRDGDLLKLPCGSYELDEFSFKATPSKCIMKALALSSLSGFKATARSQTYENVGIDELGAIIAGRNGLQYEWLPPPPKSKVVEGNTDVGFVVGLYHKYLNREPEDEGLNYWMNALETGTLNQQQVEDFFTISPEYRQLALTEMYMQYLGRAPDPEGLAYWENIIATGQATKEQIEASFSGSAEYRASIHMVYEKLNQDEADDCSFLNEQVQRCGLSMKIFDGKLVIYDEAVYEAQNPIVTLTQSDIEPDWTWQTKMAGTYTGVRLQYSNSNKNKLYTVEAGSQERLLVTNDECDNINQAIILALAAVNKANRATTTMKITIKANPRIIATSTVWIDGLGKLSGKYYVESVAWSIGSGGACKQQLSLRKVEQRLTYSWVYRATEEDIEEETEEGGGDEGGGEDEEYWEDEE